MQSSSQKINQKTKLLKVLSFFSISSELWPNIYRAWRKTFRQGYQNWKLQYSSHKIKQKIKLLKNLFYFQIFQNFDRTFTVLGEKLFGRDIKIENCSLRFGRSIGKSNFWKFFFFQILQKFERTVTVLGEKLFGRDIKIENCSLRLKRSNKKSNFWKFSFLSNSSEFWTNIYRAWRKSFRQGYQNWKLQSSSQKINQKTKLLKVFFSFSSEIWPNNYRAWRKTFRQGYQKWKLQSSSHKIKQKIKLLKNLFFFKFFRTSNEQLPCSAENFSAALSKLKNAVFVSKDQSKNQTSESSLFFQILQNFERTITVLGGKLFGRDIKIENCSLRLTRSIKKSNFWKFSFLSNSSEF